MQYGYFDDSKKEYVITTPYTPFPWINYLGNEDYFTLFSNTAGGYSFYKDARARRLTRFRYNNAPYDQEGRFFYLKENDSVWNIGVSPTHTKVDEYEARVGLGYTKITSIKDGIKASQLAFVPLGYHGEIHYITLSNQSSKKRDLKLFSYLEWALWDAQDDAANFQRNYSIGEVEIEKSTIYHKTEYRERRNHYAFFHVNSDIAGFDTDRESFLGQYRSVKDPLVVSEGISKNSIADGWQPIGSHSLDVSLEANETKKFIFIVGYVENKKEEKFEKPNVVNKKNAYQMIDLFKNDEQVFNAFEKLSAYWEEKLSYYQVQTHDEKLNRMVNIWNQYQTATTYNLSRSASYFESGIGRGMGFRDSNQDLLGYMHMDIKRTRTRILDLASTLLRDGGAYHQYSPLTKKGNADLGGGFNDDPNWLIMSTVQYIKESNDYSILDEVITYESNPLYQGTLLEHLDKAFDKVALNKGPNGLPLIGRADWNDCLNLNCFSEEPGESFQTVQNKGDGLTAESIFIGGLFVYAGDMYHDLLVRLKNEKRAKEVRNHIDTMKKAVLDKGYDGDWFLRAYDAYGNRVGSHENEEGKIFIEPQGMCVMAGIGVKEGLAEKALDSADKFLNTKYGMVLNYPAYTTYRVELGEISSYPPGYKENGGIFCHNNPWVACAEAVIGRGDRAFDVYRRTNPAYTEHESDIHKTEPYVYSQMIAGKEAKRHGEAKNSWLTGTSSWSFVAISQFILGVSADFDGLKIKPVVPSDWDSFTITRKFRDNVYEISVKKGKEKGLYVEHKRLENDIVPYVKSDKTIKVEVIL